MLQSDGDAHDFGQSPDGMLSQQRLRLSRPLDWKLRRNCLRAVMTARRWALLIAVAALAGCRAENLPAPSRAPDAPVLRRLTPFEYQNAVHDLLGADLEIKDALEPIDRITHRFTTIGAGRATLSEEGIESLLGATRELARSILADPARRVALLGCDPLPASDPCVVDFFRRFGRHAFRRPLGEEELRRLLALTEGGGLEQAIVSLLASPYFLFRIEEGERGYVLASRLAFLLWGTIPDEPLLAAAERGELASVGGLLAQADRLWASPRAQAATLHFFEEQLGLDALAGLVKDPYMLPRFSPTIGAAMRREIELVLLDLIFRRDADLRDLFTTRRTFVNRELAALYALPAPPRDGFFPATFAAHEDRAGLLGFSGILAVAAHAVETSPTLRGKLIREQLLGQILSPPPDGTTLSLLDVAPGRHVTMRELLSRHETDPACGGCHRKMDPLGLSLEHFDSLGAYRANDLGLPVDSRASLDGRPFDGCRQLGALLHDDPRVMRFFVTQFYRYALGRMEGPEDGPFLAALERDFAASGYRFRALVRHLVASERFRFVKEER